MRLASVIKPLLFGVILNSSVAFGQTSDLEESSQEIVGGTLASEGDWPMVVALQYDGGSCSGFLLTPSTVATAAHCFFGTEYREAFDRVQGEDHNDIDSILDSLFSTISEERELRITVAIGKTDVTQSGGEVIRGLGYRLHPEVLDGIRANIKRDFENAPVEDQESLDAFRLSFQYPFDHAIVYLEKDSSEAPAVVGSGVSLDEGSELRAVGFGASDSEAELNDGRLRELAVQITSEECLGCVEGTEISVRSETAGRVCQGDSGGPLMLETEDGPIVVGIASRTDAFSGPEPFDADVPCAEGFATIYARTDVVRDWLYEASMDVPLFALQASGGGCDTGDHSGGSWLAIFLALAFVRRTAFAYSTEHG